MELSVLGCSGTYPGRKSPASGYLVTTDCTAIWCDAGPGTFQALLERVSPEDLDAVVLSHLHSDHCTDLFALIHYLAFGPPQGSVAVPVFAPAGAALRFQEFLSPSLVDVFCAVMPFFEALPGFPVVVGDIDLEFAEAKHSVPATLTRFSSGGRSLVYTGDTGPTRVLEELAAGADLLLAEASLGPDDEPWEFHMTPAQAGESAAIAGVDRLVLTHLRPTLSAATAAAAASETFGRLPLVATPGLRVTV